MTMYAKANGIHWHNNRRWNATSRSGIIMLFFFFSVSPMRHSFLSFAMQRIGFVWNEMKSIQNPLEFITIKLVRFTSITFSGRSFEHSDFLALLSLEFDVKFPVTSN